MNSASQQSGPEPFPVKFGKRGELRKAVGSTGRVHLDRWLPFLVLHRGAEPRRSIARRVAVNSPAYLIWHPDDDKAAAAALAAVVATLCKRFERVLLISVNDAAWSPEKEDSPALPPFVMTVGGDDTDGALRAADALCDALRRVEIDLRKPEVEGAPPARPDTLLDQPDADRLSLSIAQIHRGPGDHFYPQLTHDLAIACTDAILQAAKAFMEATNASPPSHYRSLGRSAFLAAALHADKKLDEISRSFDFLLSVSPINTRDAMQLFLDQGEKAPPEFRYRPLTVDPDPAKRHLYEIDLSILEDPLLEQLLREKRREIDLQLTMLATRNTSRFRPASQLQYGPVQPGLLADAHAILAAVAEPPQAGRTVDAQRVARSARSLVASYQAVDDRFDAEVQVRDDVAGLLVSNGKLMIASNTAMPERRLDALLAHEVSVHLLTYFNGAAQGLTIFRTGLAGYEGVQEGLGVFAEWLVGGLSRARLRLLAARVVAVDAMIGGAGFLEVYRQLRTYRLTRKRAFDVTARVMRSGGFAKDAIYLKGFREVLDMVAKGASLDPFWLGKIAPRHVPAIEELLQRGLLHAPLFVPDFLETDEAKHRIARLRDGLPFDQILEPE